MNDLIITFIILIIIVIVQIDHVNTISKSSTSIGNIIKYTVKEDEPPGTIIGNVHKDIKEITYPVWLGPPNEQLMYTLSHTLNGMFRLDDTTWNLLINNRIDLERLCPSLCYKQHGNVSLSVNIWSNKKLRGVAKILIIILDKNDNRPYFKSSSIDITIKEVLYQKGKIIKLPKAIDADISDINRNITYSLTDKSGDFELVMEKETNRPMLRLKTTMDSEKKDRYNMELVCWNAYYPDLDKDKLKIKLLISDINDNVPKFTQSEYDILIPEKTTVGSIIYTVQARDRDETSQLTYSFTDSANSVIRSHFSINRKTGDIKLLKQVNYEAVREYSCSARVFDGEFSDIAQLKLIVVDDNDEKPDYQLVPNHIEVYENEKPGKILGQLEVRDRDSADITNNIRCYQLATHHNSPSSVSRLVSSKSTNREIVRFQLNNRDNSSSVGMDGRYQLKYSVILNRILDRDRPDGDVQLAMLRCNDEGYPQFLTSTFTLSVTLLDRNDNAPIFTRYREKIQVKESCPLNMPIFQFEAVDQDKGPNSKLRFELLPITSQVRHTFSIDPNNGSLYVISKLDRETLDIYKMVVTVHDLAIKEKRHTSSRSLTVIILDDNDNLPQLKSGSPTLFRIQENKPVNTRVGQIEAIDLDIDEAGKVSAEIVENPKLRQHTGKSRSPDFKMFKNGTIVTNKVLDREQKESYKLLVLLKDQGIPLSNSVTVTITIEIIDQNDNPPRIMLPRFVKAPNSFYSNLDQLNVSIYNKIDSIIEEIVVEDLDKGANANFSLTLVTNASENFIDNQPKQLFRLNTVNKQLLTNQKYSLTDLGCYPIMLIAEDRGNIPLRSAKKAQVCLVDSRDIIISTSDDTHSNSNFKTKLSRVNVLIIIILIGISIFLTALMISAILCLIQPIRSSLANTHRHWCCCCVTHNRTQTTNIMMNNGGTNLHDHNETSTLVMMSHENEMKSIEMAKLDSDSPEVGMVLKVDPKIGDNGCMDENNPKLLPTNLDYNCNIALSGPCKLDHNWTYTILPKINPNYYHTLSSSNPSQNPDTPCLPINPSSTSPTLTNQFHVTNLDNQSNILFGNYCSLTNKLTNHNHNLILNDHEQRSDSGRGASDEDTGATMVIGTISSSYHGNKPGSYANHQLYSNYGTPKLSTQTNQSHFFNQYPISIAPSSSNTIKDHIGPSARSHKRKGQKPLLVHPLYDSYSPSIVDTSFSNTCTQGISSKIIDLSTNTGTIPSSIYTNLQTLNHQPPRLCFTPTLLTNQNDETQSQLMTHPNDASPYLINHSAIINKDTNDSSVSEACSISNHNNNISSKSITDLSTHIDQLFFSNK